MEGYRESVGDGSPVGLRDRDREDEGLGESSAAEEGESCLVDEDEEVGSEDSNFGSSYSLEWTEDASSSSFSGPLFEFSDLMSNLPIKRGLSRYYDGKSQSFTCLGKATSLYDLIKEDYNSSYKKTMKSCKSYAANIWSDRRRRNHHRSARSHSPKATISKKSFRINKLLPSPKMCNGVVSIGERDWMVTNPGSVAED